MAIITRNINETILQSGGVAAGIAISTAFYAEFISWKILFVFFFPILFYLYRNWQNIKFSFALSVLLTVSLIHLMALVYSNTEFKYSMLKEIVLFFMFLFAALSARSDKAFAVTIMNAIALVGAFSATVGLLKHYLQDRGILMQYIVDACPLYYPQGSSLCVDYNILAASWLLAAIGLSSLWFRRSSYAALLLLPLVIAAGLLSGSRRFLILMPIILTTFWAYSCYLSIITRPLYYHLAAVTLVAIGSLALVTHVPAPEEAERFRGGAEAYFVADMQSIIQILSTRDAANEGTISIRPPNRATPSVIATTIDGDAFGTRTGRWQFAYDLIRESPYIGWGFGYHAAFVERFGGRDYPHSPLLSAGLIGGVPLLLLVLLLYIKLMWRACASSRDLQLTGLPISFIALTAVCFISGDTILSTPQWTAIAVAVAVASDERHVPSLWPRWKRAAMGIETVETQREQHPP